MRAKELPDGRWGLVAVGARRLRVEAWLADAPYPLADVIDWPDPEPGAAYPEQVEAVVGRLRRVLALAAEAGDQAAPLTIEVSDDPVLALHQVGAVAPLGLLDKQRVLAAPSPDARAEVLGELLADAEEVLLLRLGG